MECLRDSECPKGFCHTGNCKTPNAGDPCVNNSDCPNNLICQTKWKRCMSPNHGNLGMSCHSDRECPSHGFCETNKCYYGKGIGFKCKKDQHCADGLTCSDGTCRARCRVDSVCSKNEKCIEATPKAAYKVCEPGSYFWIIVGVVGALIFLVCLAKFIQYIVKKQKRRASVAANITPPERPTSPYKFY